MNFPAVAEPLFLPGLGPSADKGKKVKNLISQVREGNEEMECEIMLGFVPGSLPQRTRALCRGDLIAERSLPFRGQQGAPKEPRCLTETL